ncbi:hypothetical protein RB614_40490 [Phytohabitans sp. ZYX-F-186]|uniref:Lipoprotein n=1 Tax=Phytohabitans maris TaxID=3071409 RepID=A0ABU0ZUS4_9ACTN|nr:hypothetical protein [Phytohabitans sp. ZYX-F-186]MDQ7910789.1 hypothetical protein [Phytohabitans sp. ZYX-F-186]
MALPIGRALRLAVVGAVALAAAACSADESGTSPDDSPSGSSAPTTPTTFAITGDLLLKDVDSAVGDGSCDGRGGYSDIRYGAQITVTGANGDIVAVGELGPGVVSSVGVCRFGFGVPGVPAGLGFYGVEVARRGAVKYAERDAASPISISLGNG